MRISGGPDEFEQEFLRQRKQLQGELIELALKAPGSAGVHQTAETVCLIGNVDITIGIHLALDH